MGAEVVTMRHTTLQQAKDTLCHQAWLLGESCDAKLLTQHFKKHAGNLQADPAMDIKSESAAIYVLLVASLYLVMVVVMVGMNYSLKQRSKKTARKEVDAEDEKEEE